MRILHSSLGAIGLASTTGVFAQDNHPFSVKISVDASKPLTKNPLADNAATVNFSLPRQGVSLLVIECE